MAAITPMATVIPNCCTGSIGEPWINIRKPAAVVTEVITMGCHISLKVCATASFAVNSGWRSLASKYPLKKWTESAMLVARMTTGMALENGVK